MVRNAILSWGRKLFQRLFYGIRQIGDPINIERSLRVGDRLGGGHFVSGHVDGLGTLVERSEEGVGLILRYPPRQLC